MKNEKNITGMKQQLQSLGFGDGLETGLRSSICFRPLQFDIPFFMRKDNDSVNFRIHFEHTKDGQYACIYYDAMLRKGVDIAGSNPGMATLETRMATINWNSIIEHAESIEAVTQELNVLGQDADGEKAAGLLKYKYWCDTPAEQWVPGLASYKSQFEISQRFYISEAQGITAEEAYRFLCNKWVEKKLQAGRKAKDNPKPTI